MLLDGGFEQQSWTLGTVSPFQGVSYESDPANVAAGMRSLKLLTKQIGPTSGWAEKDATELEVGQTYQVVFRYKSLTAMASKPLRVYMGGALIASITQQQDNFVTVGPFNRVVASATEALRFDVPENLVVGSSTYWVDGVVLQQEESKLLKIARKINSLIETIAGIGGTGVGIDQHWATASDLPAAYTYLIGDEEELKPTRSKEVLARFGVYTIIKSDQAFVDFTVLRRKIEQLVEFDPSLGGLSMECYVSGSAPLNTAEVIAQGNHVADIFITVRFRHPRAEP